MKLVIDIPDEQYESVMNGTWCGPLYEELKNGVPVEPCTDCVSRDAVIRIAEQGQVQGYLWQFQKLCALPSVTPESNIHIDPISCDVVNQQIHELLKVTGDVGEISDGYHTFNQLYHQRAILFATIVNQNKNISWKSYKHADGKYCFDSNGEWFIVGIDTPEGSYTYHYSKEYWNYFECKELDCGKEWDGHTEDDVIRLLSLASVEPERKTGKWLSTIHNCRRWIVCSQCGEESIYDRFTRWNYCPNCGADMKEGDA